jgi:hypothetical protein
VELELISILRAMGFGKRDKPINMVTERGNGADEN